MGLEALHMGRRKAKAPGLDRKLEPVGKAECKPTPAPKPKLALEPALEPEPEPDQQRMPELGHRLTTEPSLGLLHRSKPSFCCTVGTLAAGRSLVQVRTSRLKAGKKHRLRGSPVASLYCYPTGRRSATRLGRSNSPHGGDGDAGDLHDGAKRVQQQLGFAGTTGRGHRQAVAAEGRRHQ